MRRRHGADAADRPAAPAAQLGRAHGHVDGRLADHRPPPIDGLYLNAGWCYGGFKATPASGWCFAHTDCARRAASAQPPPTGSTASHRPCHRRKGSRRPAESALMHESTCPYCGARDAQEFAYLGDATHSGPTRPTPTLRKRLPRLRLSARQSCRRAATNIGFMRPAAAAGSGVTRDMRTHEISRVQFACDEEPRHEPASPPAGLIDRAQPHCFTFDGKGFGGFAGRHARLGAAGQ